MIFIIKRAMHKNTTQACDVIWQKRKTRKFSTRNPFHSWRGAGENEKGEEDDKNCNMHRWSNVE